MGMPVTAAPRSASRVWWGRALLSILALWGAFTALSPLTQHLEVVRLLRDDLIYALAVFAALVTSVLAVRHGAPARRRFWILMAGTNLFWLFPEIYWGLADWRGWTIPVPSVGDYSLLISYALMVAAASVGIGDFNGLRQLRGQLDSLIVCAAICIAGWELLVHPQISGGVNAGSLVYAAYPLMDIAFLMLFLSIAISGSVRIAWPVLAVVTGIGFSLVGDILLAVLPTYDIVFSAALSKCIYLPTALFFALGALGETWYGKEDSGRSRRIALDFGMVPSVAAMGAILGWAASQNRSAHLSMGPIVLAVVLILGLAARAHVSTRTMSRLARDLETALEEQERLASTDGLTGLYNRRFAEMTVAERLAEDRPGVGTAVVLLDLDHFKRINDTYGHDVGDLVLREASNRFSAVLRGSDVLARWGGEEFLAILPGVSRENAQQVADRFRVALAGSPIDIGGGRALEVTASLGAVLVNAGDLSPDEAVLQADRLLYRAKAEGRNRSVVAA